MLLTALDVGNQWSLCEFRLAKANSQATSHARTSDIKGNELLKGRTNIGRLNLSHDDNYSFDLSHSFHRQGADYYPNVFEPEETGAQHTNTRMEGMWDVIS